MSAADFPCMHGDTGKKVRDLRNWLTIYGYWNQGGLENITTMMLYLVDAYFFKTGSRAAAPVETPSTGKSDLACSVFISEMRCLHCIADLCSSCSMHGTANAAVLSTHLVSVSCSDGRMLEKASRE